MTRSERTLKMIDNFMLHREAGMSIKQIAEKYDLGLTTVYKHLGEIAEKAGVSRSELLQFEHSPHIMSSWIDKPVEKVDTADFNEHVATVRTEMSKIQQMVRDSVKNCESFEKKMTEG